MDGFFLDASRMLLNYGAIAVPAITTAVLVGCGNNSSGGSKRNAMDKSVKNNAKSGKGIQARKSDKSNKSKSQLKKTTSKRSLSARSSSSKKGASKKSSKKKSSSSKSHRKFTKKSQRDQSAKIVKCAAVSTPKSTTVSAPPPQQQPQPPSAASMKKSESVKTQSSKKGVGASMVPSESFGILKLTPSDLRFNNRQAETLEVQLKNQSKETIAIKAKCSDNHIYRVDPVYANLEPEQTVKVSVQRDAAPFKIDKLVFAVLKVPKGSGNARHAFQVKPTTGVREALFVLPLFTTAAPSAACSAIVESVSQKQHSQFVDETAAAVVPKKEIGVLQ